VRLAAVSVAVALACALGGGCRKKAAEKVDPNAWPAGAVEGFIGGCVEKARPGIDARKVCTCVADRLQQAWTYQEFRDFSEKGRDIERMSPEQLSDFETAMTGCLAGP
jgi:hypothetical protein